MRAITLQGTTLGGLGDVSDDAEEFLRENKQAICAAAMGGASAASLAIMFPPIAPIVGSIIASCFAAKAADHGTTTGENIQAVCIDGYHLDPNGGGCVPNAKKPTTGGGGKISQTLATPVTAESSITVGHVGAALAVVGIVILVTKRRKKA